MVALLLDRGSDMAAKTLVRRCFMTLLLPRGRVWTVEPDIAAQDGNTPLHLAVMEGHVDCARLLVQRGADIYARNKVRHSFPPANQRRIASFYLSELVPLRSASCL